MGEVYEATHARLAHRYAVKFLHPGMRDHPEALPRFMREAQVTSRLRHPGIVSVVDFNTLPDGVAYLVMEYLEGEPLGKVLARTGPMPLPRVVDITDQVSSALTAAHLEGVVHRDMHPQNVFIVPATGGQGERVKVLDFGISKIASISQKITGMAAVLGTPQYMSPEQAEGKIDELDAASDQFSLAAIVYEMLTGRPAFSGETLASVAYQVVHAAVTPIERFRPELPAELDQVVSRALAKNQKARFPSISEFALHFRWTASLPVNEARRTASPEAVGAPSIEADTEETTAVSALPSGMAAVLRQTSGLSLPANAPAASAIQDEPTVVSTSHFASNEPTVVSTSMLAADDPSLVTMAPPAETVLTVGIGRNRRLRPVAALAGLLSHRRCRRRLARWRPTDRGARRRAAAAVAGRGRAGLSPHAHPATEGPASPRETTASLREPSTPAPEAPVLGRAATGGEAAAAGRPLVRRRARATASLKAAAPTEIDRTEVADRRGGMSHYGRLVSVGRPLDRRRKHRAANAGGRIAGDLRSPPIGTQATGPEGRSGGEGDGQ